MERSDPNAISRLVVRFVELQERWENDAQEFEWSALQSLAQEGAEAYNEGAGPSFHSLALDGIQHTEFHERFLLESLHAGFDPFKVVCAGSGTSEIPVLDHSGLAEDAQWNASSTRMRATLMDIGRARFEKLAEEMNIGKSPVPTWLIKVLEACASSIPIDLLERIAPELIGPKNNAARRHRVDPVEGYLSTAEVMVDNNTRPYG